MSDNICWDRTTQSLVLSSYFYGQLIAPFISGLVTQRFGVKRPMALYMLLSSVLLMATPELARRSSSLTIAVRAVQGFLGVWRKRNHGYTEQLNTLRTFWKFFLKSSSSYHVFYLFYSRDAYQCTHSCGTSGPRPQNGVNSSPSHSQVNRQVYWR